MERYLKDTQRNTQNAALNFDTFQNILWIIKGYLVNKMNLYYYITFHIDISVSIKVTPYIW